MQSNLLKRMNAQNLQSSVEASGKFQLLVEDSHQQVCRHRDPDLCFHCIGTRPEVVLDPQVPFDPFEKQLDLIASDALCSLISPLWSHHAAGFAIC